MCYVLAMAEFYQVTLIPEIKSKVLSQFTEIVSGFVNQGKLYRILTKDSVSKDATLEDYALLTQGYLAMYGISKNRMHLNQAKVYAAHMQSKLYNKSLIGMSSDTQLPSGIAASVSVLKQLYLITRNRKYLEQLNLLANKEVMQPLNLAQLSLIAAADKKQRKVVAPYYFGLGHGVAYFERQDDNLSLILSLDDGWHINANLVTNKKLIATRVEYIGSDVIGNVEYPRAESKRVEFEPEVLNLNSGSVKIQLDNRLFQTDSESVMVSVELQVCSDKLCLFPEQFNLSVRPVNLSRNNESLF